MAAASSSPVPDTRGCPRDLSVDEQVTWARVLSHPDLYRKWPVDDDLRNAVEYECNNSVNEIDSEREKLVQSWVKVAASLQPKTKTLLVESGFEKCRLRGQIHHAFLAFLIETSDHPDRSLATDVLLGFPLVGRLPPSLVEADVVPNKQRVPETTGSWK